MKSLWAPGLILAMTAACPAQEILGQYDGRQLAESSSLTGSALAQIDGRSALKVSNTNDARRVVSLLKIVAPPITRHHYALAGEVKYEQVRGDGYLELWNYFSPLKPGLSEGQYFSRTMGDSGAMGKLSGSSDWRPFLLPFDWSGGNGPPTRLELNLVLPGAGTVYLGPLKLVQYRDGLAGVFQAPPGVWWSDRAVGLVGGIGGATIGCLAGLMAWLASRGKCRALVVGVAMALIGLGGLATLFGLLALGLKQPYAVWFPLLLGGLLLMLILPFRLRQFQNHYQILELRRMVSMDK